MNQSSYLIDGKWYSEADTFKIFSESKLENREKVVLSYVNNDKDNKVIIDLGCLYGHFAKSLKEKFPNSNIVAGDYDNENLKIARLLHPNLSDNIKVLNAYNLELPDGYADIIIFQEVIEHLEGAANAIKEINRVLKIGGELILSTPTAYYWKDMWQSFKFELLKKYFKKHLALSDAIYFKEHEWNRHIYCWTPTTLYTLLKINGFEYVDHTYCKTANGFIEKMFYKLFPGFSPTIIIKARKVTEAPKKIV